jgi:hypothetical protein
MCISNKLILFDIEGILLKDDKTFSQEVIKALLKLKDNGHKFGVMTSDLWLKASGMTSSIAPDISIVASGTQVYKGDDLIWSAPLSLEQSKGIVKDLSHNPMCSFIGLTSGKYIYTNDPSEDGEYIRYRDMSIPLTQSVHEVFAMTTKEVAGSITEKYECKSFDFSGDDLCKFISKDATMGNAVKNACRILNVDLKDTVAITNDLSVLSIVGIGISCDNAAEEIKERAGLIIGDNNSDSLAEFLKEEILVK